jgi:Rod binding domain-containing protein
MSSPTITGVAALAGLTPPHADSVGAAPSPAKLHRVAQQFEALLIGEILKSAKVGATDSSGDDDGDDGDSGGDSAMDMAQTQFAQSIAMQGGLGLSHLIETGLATDSANQKVKTSERAPTGAKS